MSYRPQSIDRRNIELLAQCLPLIKSPKLVIIVASIVCMGSLPTDEAEIKEGEAICDGWLCADKTPARYCRSGHAWEVEQSVAYYLKRVFDYVIRGWPAHRISSEGIYWSYRRYEDRQQRLTLP